MFDCRYQKCQSFSCPCLCAHHEIPRPRDAGSVNVVSIVTLFVGPGNMRKMLEYGFLDGSHMGEFRIALDRRKGVPRDFSFEAREGHAFGDHGLNRVRVGGARTLLLSFGMRKQRRRLGLMGCRCRQRPEWGCKTASVMPVSATQGRTYHGKQVNAA